MDSRWHHVAIRSDRRSPGGDFFACVPSGADAYLLSNVLMDWDDDAAADLLRACAAAMRDTAVLLVVERMIPADNRASLSQLSDLAGLVITGGRIRGHEELDALLAAAGLERTRHLETVAGYSIVEARSARR